MKLSAPLRKDSHSCHILNDDFFEFFHLVSTILQAKVSIRSNKYRSFTSVILGSKAHNRI